MKRMHEMPFGARPDGKGGARFRLWAPGAQRVELIRSGGGLDQGTYPMQARPAGWFELDMARVDARTDYAFHIDRRIVVPDPASRSNHFDVHGPSAFVDPLAFDWPDDAWTGRSGLVHRAVLEDHADLSAYQVYACGAPAMIDAARAEFVERGLPAEEFFADAFTFAPVASALALD